MAGDSLLSSRVPGAKLTAFSSIEKQSSSSFFSLQPERASASAYGSTSSRSAASTAGSNAASGPTASPAERDDAVSGESAGDSAALRQGEESTSRRDAGDAGSSLEDVHWDLVALKVLLADDRPGSDHGAPPCAILPSSSISPEFLQTSLCLIALRNTA